MIADERLSALLRAVVSESGLLPRADWAMQAQRALGVVAERWSCSIDSLLDNQAGWPSLSPELLKHLTVGETYFFRHPSHFDLLVDALAARLAADPLATASVLSAGCATGEEPYSVAIAVHARLGAQALARVRIVASDISAESINKARAAVYTAWAFREAPAWLAPRYCQHSTGRGCQVVDVVRRAVTFDVAHLVDHAAGLPDGSVDAALFRNVAIYLAPHVVADAYRELRRVLKPDGLLFVAPADPRPDSAGFVEIGHESTSVYRARATTNEPDRAPAPSSRRARRAHWLRREGRRAALRSPPVAKAQRPAAPASGATSVRWRAPAPSPDPSAQAQAMCFADRGDCAAALTLLTNIVEHNPTAPEGYMIRAQIELAGGHAEAAVEDLRRTLFLKPEHRLARYWYVVALQGVGEIRHAIVQGRALEQLLTEAAGEALLEDGETTARHLLDAVRFVMEGLT